jgi:acetylornithine deacetylase/succinyl-diaminopimelate desuccinylase-like protein
MLALDRAYLIETLSELAQVPTNVPMGHETFIAPDDPKLVHYVQEVIRPELLRLGVYDVLDAAPNNIVACAGKGESGKALLIQNYTPSQHHNFMEDPFSGKVGNAREFGVDEPAVFGQGVSQNKAHQAVMLTVLKALAGTELGGRLYWAVNNEGRSSHACSMAVIDALPQKPSFSVIQLGTGLKISVGNRGRVDVNVHLRGSASHSSRPDLGHNAIDGAYELMTRLKHMSWADRHPLLGGRHAIVYKLRYEPLAPHTLPSEAFITIDRRLLPGDDVTVAVEEVRQALGDMSPYQLTIEQGEYMLPALVEPEDPGLRALTDAHRQTTGAEPERIYGQGTFDAGGPCSRGIPTVMYGASGGVWPLGADFVPISMVETEANTLTRLILSELA